MLYRNAISFLCSLLVGTRDGIPSINTYHRVYIVETLKTRAGLVYVLPETCPRRKNNLLLPKPSNKTRHVQ